MIKIYSYLSALMIVTATVEKPSLHALRKLLSKDSARRSRIPHLMHSYDFLPIGLENIGSVGYAWRRSFFH